MKKRVTVVILTILLSLTLFFITGCGTSIFDRARNTLLNAGYTISEITFSQRQKNELREYLGDRTFQDLNINDRIEYIWTFHTARNIIVFESFFDDWDIIIEDSVLVHQVINNAWALELAVLIALDSASENGPYFVYRNNNVVFHGNARALAIVRNAIGGTRYSLTDPKPLDNPHNKMI